MKWDTFITFDGTEISYIKYGNPSKQKVFMLHGFTINKYVWLPYIISLLQDYCFIIMDMRSHGSSKNNNFISNNAFDDIAQDLWLLIQKETNRDEQIKLIGYSMGCLCSLRMMYLYGHDKIEKYIHIDHALEFMNHPDINKRIFLDRHDEFMEEGLYMDNIVQSNPDVMRNTHIKHIKRAEEEQYKKIINLFEILVTNATFSGIKYRLPFLTKINIPHMSYWMTRLLDFSYKWPEFMAMGSCYIKTQHDYCNIVRELPVSMTFFVGKISRIFNPEYHIETIKDCKPDAKIVVFEKSGHDLMFNEPILFYQSLKEELKN